MLLLSRRRRLRTLTPADESAHRLSSLLADVRYYPAARTRCSSFPAVLIVFIIFGAVPGDDQAESNYRTRELMEPASKDILSDSIWQGCDVCSRRVHGTRTSLSVGVFAVGASGAVGALIPKSVDGFFGGWVGHHSQPFDRYFPGFADFK